MIKVPSLCLAILLTACGVVEHDPVVYSERMTLLSSQTIPSNLIETRYCGAPNRDATGKIIRDSSVIAAYKRIHVCPSTGLYGNLACPGWSLNHPMPLACGGCDAVSNLMYMRNDVKREVDKYERSISALNPPISDTANCINKIQ